MREGRLVGIVCTIDISKRDTEVKLLIGCTPDEVETVFRFHNNDYMSAIVIQRC